MSQRKYIRIALSENDFEMFAKAKQLAEKELGMSLSDSMFALSLIRQSVKKD